MRAILFGLLLWASGCGEKAPRPGVIGSNPTVRFGDHGLAREGMLGVPVEVAFPAGVLSVPIAVDGVRGLPAIVDTGSPLTILDPDGFPGARLPVGVGRVGALAVGAITLRDVPVVGEDRFSEFGLSGVIGTDVLCRFVSTFDYRDRRFALGEGALPGGVGAAIPVPFRLEGGTSGVLADGRTVAVPPSRLMVAGSIEGEELRLMVDTGASLVVLRRSRIDAMVRDGRVGVELPVITFEGVVPSVAVRLRTARVLDATGSGVDVDSLAAISFSDRVLDEISAKTGRRIDGLIGVSFLREFLVTLDYPQRRIVLRRYADRAHVLDEFRRVGVSLRPRAGEGGPNRYQVAHVFPRSDAASRRVAVGQAVTAVDGRDLGMLDVDAVDRLLRGAVGQTRTLTIDDQRVELRVEELLPLP